MDNIQHLALGKSLDSSDVQENISKWRKSKWCVPKEYDQMIIEANQDMAIALKGTATQVLPIPELSGHLSQQPSISRSEHHG